MRLRPRRLRTPILAATASALGVMVSAPIAASIDFSSRHVLTSAAIGAQDVIVADLDGNGQVDIVAASQFDHKLHWSRRSASGDFETQVITSSATGAAHLAAADLDGDGDVDLVVAGTALAWYENKGTSTFSERVIDARAFTSLSTADLDRDGDPDLIVTGHLGSDVRWFRNDPDDGDRFFLDLPLAATNLDANDAAVADFDRDGHLDVVAAFQFPDGLAWFRNDGSQSFTKLQFPLPFTEFNYVTAVDLDTDGDVDIVTENGTIIWYDNDGSGNFSEDYVPNADPPEDVAGVDLDDDGDRDLIDLAGFSLDWYENDGSQGFTRHSLAGTVVSGGAGLAVADLDADGDQDVAVASANDHTVGWYENLTPPASARLPASLLVAAGSGGPSGIDGGDIDRDGIADLVVGAVSDDTIVWYERATDGSFLPHSLATGGGELVDGVNSVELFDFDRDGDLDALSAAAVGGDVAWHENPGPGGVSSWGHHAIDASAIGVRHATAGDLDGDGDLDVVAAVGGEGKVFWYENIGGDGTFATGLEAVSSAPAVRSVDLGDLDRDGDLDIAFAAPGAAGVAWVRNEGVPEGQTTLAFGLQPIDDPFPAPFWIRIDDVDGDGRADLLATSFANDAVAWFRNLGGMAPDTPAFDLAWAQSGVPGVTDLETVDLDRDGDLDFVVTARDADRLVWFEIAGPGQLPRSRPLPPALDGALSLVSVDLDTDGTIDLAVANEAGASVVWLPNLRAIFWDNFERGDDGVWNSSVP